MGPNKLALVAVLAFALAAPIVAYQTGKLGIGDIFGAGAIPRGTFASEFPALGGATGWLNSPPLSAAELRGKVVLIDFWTYSCINWRRELPYVRAWAEKYRQHGLVVIGVHTPEFAFEKDVDNIRWALKDMNIDYPVAIDSDYAIWRAFDNNYWPALYFIDANGRIRGRHFGEGDYDKSERMIQQLLAEAGGRGFASGPVSVEGEGAEAAPDFANLRTPEIYLGHGRTANFASEGGVARDKGRVYAAPTSLKLNTWALSGDWTVKREAALLNQPGGRIALRFHARDVHLVMGPSARGASVRFRVRIDGQPPGASHGVDVDAEGHGTASEQRMYQLIRQVNPVADRRFEIELLDPGVEAFSFTFG